MGPSRRGALPAARHGPGGSVSNTGAQTRRCKQATDLVSQVLKRNIDKVDEVAAGKIKGATLEHRFDFVTGKEAFRPNGDSDPYIRDTYGVRVIIRHDARSWRGYRVHTAFPVND
jgi:hypothetical protein